MRTIKLHYFCQPPFIGKHERLNSLMWDCRDWEPLPPFVAPAKENRQFLSGFLLGNLYGELGDIVKAAFVTDNEYKVNLSRFLHCGETFFTEHEHYIDDIFKYKEKVLSLCALDQFKIIAADHGLSVEVRSIVSLYDSYQKELDKKCQADYKEHLERIEKFKAKHENQTPNR